MSGIQPCALESRIALRPFCNFTAPISVMSTAGEGGAWGIALLAAYAVNNADKLSLADYLDQVVFAGNTGSEVRPTAEDVAGFNRYIENYKACLPVEQKATECKAAIK